MIVNLIYQNNTLQRNNFSWNSAVDFLEAVGCERPNFENSFIVNLRNQTVLNPKSNKNHCILEICCIRIGTTELFGNFAVGLHYFLPIALTSCKQSECSNSNSVKFGILEKIC